MARQLEHFTHDGHRLAYETRGDGERTVVLLHGLLLSKKIDRKSTRLNSSHIQKSRMPSSA